MSTLLFQPKLNIILNYRIQPANWMVQSVFHNLLAWPNLRQLAEFAHARKTFINTDSMVGFEYPTRQDKAGMIRLIQGHFHPSKKVKIRKYYFPEGDYLATIKALMLAHGWQAEAELIGAVQPTEPIHICFEPDIRLILNYQLAPFDKDAYLCLGMLLNHPDWAICQELATAGQGFCLDNGAQLSYLPERQLLLQWPTGQSNQVSEDSYLAILNQLLALHDGKPTRS